MIDFCGGGPLAIRLGFNVIMIDQRAHGESEGRTISFGYNESADVIGWVNYVREHYGNEREVMLFGISMGAATVLLASCRNELPDNVVCAIADCPFASAKKIVTKVMKDLKISSRIIYPFARLGAIVFGDFDPKKSDAEAAVKNLKIPLILIHGEADDFVPCDMSRDIQKASGGKITLHTVPGAAHGVSYLVDMPSYENIFIDFCKKHVKGFKHQA
jgi:pimeloyl-ACP methyl ester carboxylesterase